MIWTDKYSMVLKTNLVKIDIFLFFLFLIILNCHYKPKFVFKRQSSEWIKFYFDMITSCFLFLNEDLICLLNLNIIIVTAVMTCDNLELLKSLRNINFSPKLKNILRKIL